MNTNKHYIMYIEVMRIVAIYFVIFNHTSINGFFLFSQYDENSLQYWIYLFFSIFCKFAVPLFFAISGLLLLNKEEESLKTIFFKRIARIAFCLIFFSVISYLQYIYNMKSGFSIKEFLVRFYENNWNTAYWYLWAYITFLMSLPFLQVLVKNLKGKYFIYMIVIVIFFNGIFPVFQYYFMQDAHKLNTDFSMNWLTRNIVIYPCIGYFLEYRLALSDKKKLLALWILNVIAIGISCYMTNFQCNILGECLENTRTQAFYNSFVLINCITMFITIKKICEYLMQKGVPAWLERIIISMGRSTFGIFLIHVIIMRVPVINTYLLDIMRVQLGMNYMISVLIYCAIIFFVSYIITLVMKRLPILKKVL